MSPIMRISTAQQLIIHILVKCYKRLVLQMLLLTKKGMDECTFSLLIPFTYERSRRFDGYV
jgi:hypothetical protein